MKSNEKTDTSTSVIDLAEQAFQLIRKDAAGFGVYHIIGSVPFWLYLIHFVESMSFRLVHSTDLILSAAIATTLYIWMRTMHSFACESARRSILGEKPISWSFKKFALIYGRQAKLSGVSLWFNLISANILLTAGYAFSYSQTTVACSYRAKNAAQCRRNAWKTTSSRPRASHRFFALYSFLWLVLWVNTSTLFYFLPDLLRSIFGLKNFMAIQGLNTFSTTFLTITAAATSCIANAFSKSFHTLLCFERESTTTGDDILAKLDRLPLPKSLMLLAIIFTIAVNPIDCLAQENLDTRSFVEQTSVFDSQADKTLAGSEYAWKTDTASVKEDPSESFILKFLAETTKSVGDWAESLIDWLMGNGQDRDHPTPSSTHSSSYTGPSDGLMKVLIVIGIIIVCILIFAWLSRVAQHKEPASQTPKQPTSNNPNLEDESVHASDMPFDRWIALGADKANAGEFRLAVRAVFLASLSLLGERRFIALAKSKANFEYAQELKRRGLVESGQDAFQKCRSSFDRTWYGTHIADEDLYDQSVAMYGKLEAFTRQ